MTAKMKRLIKEATFRLSEGSSEDLMLAIEIDNELYRNKSFMEFLEEN